MSSEMRELIEHVVEAAIALERAEATWCGDPIDIEVPRRELEAAKSTLLARTEAALMREREGWRPISSPPTEYGWYLCHVEETNDLGISRWSKTISWGNAAGIGDTFFVPCGERVTHWQPLPAAPTTTGEAQG